MLEYANRRLLVLFSFIGVLFKIVQRAQPNLEVGGVFFRLLSTPDFVFPCVDLRGEHATV